MTKRSQFSGAPRGVMAIAMLTMRELLRTGSAPISFLLYLLFLATYRADLTIAANAASARFLDHALGGASLVVLFLSVFFALQLAVGRESPVNANAIIRKTAGAATHLWGRILGMSAVLVAFGLLAGTLVVVHHSVRFRDAFDSPLVLEKRSHGEGFVSARDVRILRKKGDETTVRFDLSDQKFYSDKIGAAFSGRISPRLVLLAATGGIRAQCPIRLSITAPGSDWSARRIVRLREGRGAGFSFTVPKGTDPRILEIKVTNLSKGYLVKFGRDQLEVTTGTSSFPAGVMRGALIVSLLASILGSLAFFARQHLGFFAALVVAIGCVALTLSVDLLEHGVLAKASETVRALIVESVTTILPDADDHDVVGDLVKRKNVSWDSVAALTARWLLGALLLGLVDGWIQKRRVAS